MTQSMARSSFVVRRVTTCLVLLFLVCLVSVQLVSGTYVAAVVDHAITSPSATPLDTKVANLNIYMQDVATAASLGAQIVLFPEFGLLGSEANLLKRATTVAYAELVPDVPTNNANFIVPCNNATGFANSPTVFYGSCAALKSRVSVVINLFESVKCSPAETTKDCPKDGQFIYNTNIVFNENGEFVTKYRKTHPFFITSVDAPPADQPLITYQASFGVNFGLFICFDIAFSHPAIDLVKSGVQHFLYSADIALIGKSTVARLWSWTNHATLLLSNHGSGSSDILVNGSSIVSATRPVPGTKDNILIALVD